MSTILFNIVADMLALLIKHIKNDWQINEIILHLVDDVLSILQYADDTIIFLDHDLEQARQDSDFNKGDANAIPIHVSITVEVSPWIYKEIYKLRRAFIWTGSDTASGG
jgi:hypothetical protein